MRTKVPAYQARLPKMGWQPAGGPGWPGARPTGTDPPREQEETAAGHLELIPWRGRRIPVPIRQVQLAAAERRGLADRAALIRQAMRS